SRRSAERAGGAGGEGTPVETATAEAAATGELPQAAEDAEGAAALAATVERLREELDGLRQAMRSRAAIEQAKGMLMERHGIGPDEAFERLARLSQHANIKLVDVAAALVEVSLSDTMRSAATAPERSGSEGHAGQQARTPADVARTARRQLVERWPHQGEEGE